MTDAEPYYLLGHKVKLTTHHVKVFALDDLKSENVQIAPATRNPVAGQNGNFLQCVQLHRRSSLSAADKWTECFLPRAVPAGFPCRQPEQGPEIHRMYIYHLPSRRCHTENISTSESIFTLCSWVKFKLRNCAHTIKLG